MSIMICDCCGDYIEKDEIFYEKIKCTYISDDDVCPQEIIQRLCEQCEVLLR